MLANTDYAKEFDRLNDYYTSEKDKKAISDKLTLGLLHDLRQDHVFVDSLKDIPLKITKSKDKLLTFYQWSYRLRDGYWQYGGVMCYKDVFVPLKYNSKFINEHEKYTVSDWCGGIYYDIASFSLKNKKYYTLLAWDGNNSVTSKKIIEILSFDRNDNAIFGYQLFGGKLKSKNRVVLEYSASNSLMLEFNDSNDAIITNALVSIDKTHEVIGVYQGVGDGFNSYRFENNVWVLYLDIDLRMSKKDSEILQNRFTQSVIGL